MRDTKNVLLIVIDQLRADCVFGELAAHIDLPNLRGLMDDAVTFQRHFSVVNPCGPSRASLLTGQYAMNHRSVRNGTPLRHDIPNVATEMRKSGYLPMLFGYTDTSQDPRVFHANDPALRTYEHYMNGFEEVVEMRFEMSYPWRAHLINQGYELATFADLFHPVSPTGGVPKINDPAPYKAKDSDTAFLTDQFLAIMPAYAKESWFAHLTYIRPHPPLIAPAPFNDMYDPTKLPLPKRFDDPADEVAIHPFFEPSPPNRTPAGNVKGFPDLAPSDENTQTLRAIYFGLITEVDEHIGRVIKFLKDSGQYDNTLIVVTADHGEMLGDRHSWGKFSVHEAAYHTPLIIREPGNAAQAGTIVTAPPKQSTSRPQFWIGSVKISRTRWTVDRCCLFYVVLCRMIGALTHSQSLISVNRKHPRSGKKRLALAPAIHRWQSCATPILRWSNLRRIFRQFYLITRNWASRKTSRTNRSIKVISIG